MSMSYEIHMTEQLVLVRMPSARRFPHAACLSGCERPYPGEMKFLISNEFKS
jgi:hypothetical protein